MIAMIISAVVAAVQGIGGPSEERTADIECVYEYRTSDDKGREDVYSTILQVGKRSAKFVDYSTFQLDSARTSGASRPDVDVSFSWSMGLGVLTTHRTKRKGMDSITMST